MAAIPIHKDHIKEHVQAINEAIAVGMERRPATVALHASACSISLLEMYLHLLGKINTGTVVKHEWFKPPKPGQKILPLAERKIEAEFPGKEELFSLMYTIEEHRNKLIYGKPSKEALHTFYNAFSKLHHAIKQRIEEKGETLE